MPDHALPIQKRTHSKQQRFDANQALYEEKEMSPEPNTPHDVDQVHIEDFQIAITDHDHMDLPEDEGADEEHRGHLEEEPEDEEGEEMVMEKAVNSKSTKKALYATADELSEVMANLERIKSRFAELSNDVKEQEADIAASRERLKQLQKGRVYGALGGDGVDHEDRGGGREAVNEMGRPRENKAPPTTQRGTRRKRKFVDAMDEEEQHIQKRRRFGS